MNGVLIICLLQHTASADQKTQWGDMMPDGGHQPCLDYHHLNGVTTRDRYPVSHMQDCSVQLARKVIFSKVDIVRGYHQGLRRGTPVPPVDCLRTASTSMAPLN
ncbi:hypothetical protein AAFF_G00399880 [Aldrovandia affinis]|uniref:Secreted protein n=1 Tax=Aldrovandia affinis TaxID=143900 RepID=A0AAD7SD84_9TELE|nr:hypothetical protein AAFF_G00399880 [Aldrovandia affinis]